MKCLMGVPKPKEDRVWQRHTISYTNHGKKDQTLLTRFGLQLNQLKNPRVDGPGFTCENICVWFMVCIYMLCVVLRVSFTWEFYISSPIYFPMSVILEVSLFPWIFHHPFLNLIILQVSCRFSALLITDVFYYVYRWVSLVLVGLGHGRHKDLVARGRRGLCFTVFCLCIWYVSLGEFDALMWGLVLNFV